ncbi:unnamed protein product [Lota lota]
MDQWASPGFLFVDSTFRSNVSGHPRSRPMISFHMQRSGEGQRRGFLKRESVAQAAGIEICDTGEAKRSAAGTEASTGTG